MSVALVGSGLAAVLAQRLGWQLIGRARLGGRMRRWVPGVAAVVVVALGTIMTVTSLANISILG